MNKNLTSTAALTLVSLVAAAAPKQPNVLVIMTDEQNFRTIGAYRETLPEFAAYPWGKGVKSETPNLDYLASQGALCTAYYGSKAVSSPSRSSLVSGMFPENTDVVLNDIHMNDNIVTFAQTLLENGYHTGYAGKWHLDGSDKPGWAPKAKFGFADNRYMFNRGHDKVIVEKDGKPMMGVNAQGKNLYAKNASEKTFTTDYLADRTVEFIKENSKKPFCYMLSIPDPHTPNSVREPYSEKYKSVTFERPISADKSKWENIPAWLIKGGKKETGKTIIDMPNQMAAYWGMVECIDDNMGKIIKALKDEGIFENTIIVFTSDHGDMLGEHNRDNKGLPHEGSAKVPFIIYYKDVIKPATIITEPMSNPDFTPTLLSLLGVKSDIKYDGVDCAKIFTTGKAPKGWDHKALFSFGGWVASSSGRYKMVCQIDKATGLTKGVDPVLFDIESDPLEMKNIYGSPATKKIETELYASIVKHCNEIQFKKK
ncbi:MAG: sulfatase-like hydrolase/transferase [Rikenellaceae bacterium]